MDRIVFMKTLNNILNTSDFDCFNGNHKLIIYKYVDHFSENRIKLKVLFDNIVNIVQKKISDSIDDILERYNKILIDDINYNKTANYF